MSNEPVETVEQAWAIVFADATRGNMVDHVRVEKSAVPLDPFRVQQEEAPHTRVMLVTLAPRFLLASLVPAHRRARARVLHRWCQRSDRRLEKGRMPLSRLRWALCRLWLVHSLV